MNPLQWKREHQLALLSAAALGLIIGVTVGLHQVNPYGVRVAWKLWCTGSWGGCTYFRPGYWLAVAAWAAFGGAIGAALIFIRQLLRA